MPGIPVVTLPKLGTILPFAAVGLALFAAGRCTAPTPAGPSRDSLSLVHFADSTRAEAKLSAKRDSLRNATVDSLVDEVDKARRTARIALQPRPRPVQPVGAAPDSIRWLAGRVDSLDAENDSLRAGWAATLVADSVAVDSLAGLYRGQLRETARLRGLLLRAANSLSKAAIRIGQLEAETRDRWSLCAFGGVGGTAGLAGTPNGSGPGAAIGGTVGLGACYRIW